MQIRKRVLIALVYKDQFYVYLREAALVGSQFAALELPTGEPGVLRVDALAPLSQLQAEVIAWLRSGGRP